MTPEEIAALVARLNAAELVCGLFGITGTRGNGDRECAVTQAWMDWSRLPNVPFVGHDWPSEEVVAELAARRRNIHAATLARLRRDS